MNRCTPVMPMAAGNDNCAPWRWVASTLLGFCFMAMACPTPAQENPAQNIRTFPPNALRGELMVVQPPDVRMNGAIDRLSPGARIRGTNNMLVMSSTLIGQKVLVNYVRERNGLLQEIWILTTAEASLQLPSQLP